MTAILSVRSRLLTQLVRDTYARKVVEVIVLGCLLTSSYVFGQSKPLVKEGYPIELANKLNSLRELERQAASKISAPMARYIVNKVRWAPGTTVVVAFEDGPSWLHGAIAAVANEWSSFANVRFDFGFDKDTKTYRKWSSQDTSYNAHIRISFRTEPLWAGYWSAIGSTSMNPSAHPHNEPSMNYGSFANRSLITMPQDWKGVVRHEFGHALGFHHEHQQLNCVAQIRWNVGPNGEPSVYDVLKEEYGWSAPMVDANLKANWVDQTDLNSNHDPKSIMHYDMPARAFIDPEKSTCFLRSANNEFSALDKVGAQKAYPFAPQSRTAEVGGNIHAVATAHVEGNDARLTDQERAAYLSRSRALDASQRPLLYVHIDNENQRGFANDIQNRARGQGFIAPGIENVAKKGIRIPLAIDVRYFREIDKESAEQAAYLIRELRPTSTVRVVRLGALANKVTRNLIEIWIGNKN